ncbi:MAG: type II secretion system F family protein [Firmicutes bacterium]|nr:type II secretion system F family protein [Bacillota bacterium]
MKNYGKHRLSAVEKGLAAGVGGLICAVVVGVFFRSLIMMGIAVGVGMTVAPFYWRRIRQNQIQKQLRYEFRECLGMMTPVLRTGRSIEGAIEALCEDMDPEETPLIYEEVRSISNGLKLHTPIEELFQELGDRSGVGDIQDFAEILSVSKRSRGEVVEMMERTVEVLEEKMESEEELRVILAKRKMEQRILTIMPFAVIFMLMIMSPGYLEPLYSTLQGRAVMVVCVVLMVFSHYLSGRITKINV